MSLCQNLSAIHHFDSKTLRNASGRNDFEKKEPRIRFTESFSIKFFVLNILVACKLYVGRNAFINVKAWPYLYCNTNNIDTA